MFSESDGSIHATSPIHEGPGLDAWAEWLPNGPVISVGPLVTPPEIAIMHEKDDRSSVESEVEQFLEKALSDHGERSVIYVRLNNETCMHSLMGTFPAPVVWNCFLVC